MKYPPEQKDLNFEADTKNISSDTLIELFKTMLLIQKVELGIDRLYHEDEMKTPVHLCLGQEAIAAGVCAHLQKKDLVFTNHRGHGHYIAKGGDIKAMVAELYNRETGVSKGRGGSMHLIDTEVGLPGSSSIVGGCIPIATGAALSFTMKKSSNVSIAFFGDAAVEEGVIYESINFAVLKNLPVIYVCENNFYSVYSPLDKRQANDDIYRRFDGLSIPSYRVDGNNVAEVFQISKKAIDNARNGGGPSFLECRTYRIRDHHGTGSGADVGYRKQKELDEWKAKCPVNSFKEHLLNEKIISEKEVDELDKEFDKQVHEAFEFARNSPFPDENTVTNHLFY